jgi:alginate O-acetyltransferase complex protein AlgI
MLFNSIDFAVFLPIVFLLYWFVANRSLRIQNLFVTIVSYIFYGWWDVRFLTLIIFSSLLDFFLAVQIDSAKDSDKKKRLLRISLCTNLGILGFFKYFNFFAESFADAFTFLGAEFSPTSLNVALPVGISFYTLQTLGYTIDVYRGQLSATRDPIAFAAFVSFFPQLVAGPIERAGNLLPQFFHARVFDYSRAVGGMRQILWGLFTKVVIADNCAVIANAAFNNTDAYSGSSLVAGAIFFTLQVYCDFSGYSNIAIGTAHLFGFQLMRNFAFPYFSRDIAEFWRRWHISLSTWFRDYVYIPLGGSRCDRLRSVRNVFVVFLLSGFWHGANWTFIAWGALNAAYFLPLLLLNVNRRNTDTVAAGRRFPKASEMLAMTWTFSMCTFAWIFFRAQSIGHASLYIRKMFTGPLLQVPEIVDIRTSALAVVFLLLEWSGREKEYAIADLGLTWPRSVRWAMYYGLCTAIAVWAGKQQEFIYFQF